MTGCCIDVYDISALCTHVNEKLCLAHNIKQKVSEIKIVCLFHLHKYNLIVSKNLCGIHLRSS